MSKVWILALACAGLSILPEVARAVGESRKLHGYLNVHVTESAATAVHTLWLTTSSHPEGFIPSRGDWQLEAGPGVKNLFTMARQAGPLNPVDLEGVEVSEFRVRVDGITPVAGPPQQMAPQLVQQWLPKPFGPPRKKKTQ